MATPFKQSSPLPFKDIVVDEWKSVPLQPEEEIDTHVFWDWDKAKLPKGFDIRTLFSKIEDGLKRYESKLRIKTFVACGDFYGLSQNEEQGDKGRISKDRITYMEKNEFVVLVVPSRERNCEDCGKSDPDMTKWNARKIETHKSMNYQDRFSRVMDVGNGILAAQMKYLHFTHPPPGVVLLLSGDGEFSSTLKFMAQRGYRNLVSNSNHSPALQEYARAAWQWEHLIQGMPPLSTWPEEKE